VRPRGELLGEQPADEVDRRVDLVAVQPSHEASR
jgi:hypothetical protein